jgi:hypothetical protein
METKAALQEDLNFIRAAVNTQQRGSDVPAIGLMWGLFTLIGYPILDWRPEYEGVFWMIAGPVGGLISWRLAAARARRLGEAEKSAVRFWLHFAVCALAIFLLSPLVACGWLKPAGIGPVIVLFVAFNLALGAIYINPRMGWFALALALGYGLLFIMGSYVWTTIGALFFCATLVNYLLSRCTHAEA